MERKVIFATNIPFMKQHITDMYIYEIGEKYKVEMWDLSRLYGCKDEVDNTFSDAKTFSTLDKFDAALEHESNQYEIIVITNILNSYLGKIIDSIHKYNIPIELEYNTTVAGMNPNYFPNLPIEEKIDRFRNGLKAKF